MIAAPTLLLLSPHLPVLSKSEREAVHRCVAAFMAPTPRTGMVDASDDRRMLLTCFPYAPTQRITGVWIAGFEQSYFINSVSALAPGWRARRGTAELCVSPLRVRELYDMEHGRRRIYRVTFDGHRPLDPKRIGIGNPVVVERFNSIRRLPDR